MRELGATVLQPSRFAVIFFTVLLAPFAAFATFAVVAYREYLGLLLVALFGRTWLYIVSIRVQLSPGRIALSRFGRLRWDVAVTDCDFYIRSTGPGSGGRQTARLAIYDKRTQKLLGEIFPGPLSQADWERVLLHTGYAA